MSRKKQITELEIEKALRENSTVVITSVLKVMHVKLERTCATCGRLEVFEHQWPAGDTMTVAGCKMHNYAVNDDDFCSYWKPKEERDDIETGI